MINDNNKNINAKEKKKLNNNTNNKEALQITSNKRNNPEINHFNKKLNTNRNTSKGILNDSSQLPSRIVGNDKGFFNHGNDDMSGSNISIQESNSNINNYINGSDLNIDQPSSIKQNSPINDKSVRLFPRYVII